MCWSTTAWAAPPIRRASPEVPTQRLRSIARAAARQRRHDRRPVQDNLVGSVGYKQSQTIYLELQNTSTDANAGVASLTDLSILRYSIGGGSNSAFSVPTGLGDVQAENSADFIEIPITVIGNSTIV